MGREGEFSSFLRRGWKGVGGDMMKESIELLNAAWFTAMFVGMLRVHGVASFACDFRGDL